MWVGGRVVQTEYKHTAFCATDACWHSVCQFVFCKFNRIFNKIRGSCHLMEFKPASFFFFISNEGSFCNANISLV